MIASLIGGAVLAPIALASPNAASVVAQRASRPSDYAIQDVRIERGDAGRRATLILRGGRVQSVLEADAEVPHGMRIVAGSEFLALPAFIDAYTKTGCTTPQPVQDQDKPLDLRSDVDVDMRLANRKGIQPSFRAADVLALDKEAVDAWTAQGFGALLCAPSGQLLAGSSALATVREAAARDLVVTPVVHAHAAFSAEGRGYPSTLMGYHAQLRQFFLDVQHHGALERRFDQGRPGPRPPFDDELDAGRELLSGEQLVVCEAESARDIERWLGLASEFGLRIAISGGRDAWKVADELRLRNVPVILTLDWEEEVDDPDAKQGEKKKGDGEDQKKDDDNADDEEEKAWLYEEPLGLRRERRARWEEQRDCAIRLHEAGVTFAFGTAGKKPKDLMKKVRDLIEAGLSDEAALAALTTAAAEIVGADLRFGRIAPDMDATLVLWDGDPLVEKRAEPAWVFVDGFALERERKEKDKAKSEGPAKGVDASGNWTLELTGEGPGPQSGTLMLEMADDGSLTGSGTLELGRGRSVEVDIEGSVSGTEIKFSGTYELRGEELSFDGTATLDGDAMKGSISAPARGDEEPWTRDLSAVREPETKGGAR